MCRGKVRHNRSVPNYAAAFEGPEPFFWVSLLALLACAVPLCPRAFGKSEQPTKGPWERTPTVPGLRLFLCRNLRIGTKLSQWNLNTLCQSLHQISPFQMSHVPNFLLLPR